MDKPGFIQESELLDAIASNLEVGVRQRLGLSEAKVLTLNPVQCYRAGVAYIEICELWEAFTRMQREQGKATATALAVAVHLHRNGLYARLRKLNLSMQDLIRAVGVEELWGRNPYIALAMQCYRDYQYRLESVPDWFPD